MRVMDTIYTKVEAAELLRVSLRTIDRWIAEGRISAAKPGGRTIRIPQSEIDRILAPTTAEAA